MRPTTLLLIAYRISIRYPCGGSGDVGVLILDVYPCSRIKAVCLVVLRLSSDLSVRVVYNI